ncbi:MAG: 30S ribosomal protein S6 [Patescibacteria group bacterium]
MKIVKEANKRQYELTFLLDPTLTDTERKDIEKKVQSLVKKHHGDVISEEDWGKKTLAYTIKKKGKKYQEATYSHWVVEFVSTEAPEFEKDLFLNQDIVRHLLVLAEEDSVAGSQTEQMEELAEADLEK